MDNVDFDKEFLESILKRRFFYAPSFDIYGGVSGLYDYGPPGCSLQANIVDIWRKHFIFEENMLEVDCSILTPHEVLKTSGHVDRFADWMSKDHKTGELFRVDHLIEQTLNNRLSNYKNQQQNTLKENRKSTKTTSKENITLNKDLAHEYETVMAKIDGYSGIELGKLMEKYDIMNPTTGGQLQLPVAFNLMFETAIGPSGQLKGYLRPETAQGQFLNFNKLLECNNGKTPFASASIGKSFRNEISPRAGLLRAREFLMAEIEHFVDPDDKKHPRFNEIKEIKLPFLARDIQEGGSSEAIITSIGNAVEADMVDNETLGYFLGRIYEFLIIIGIDKKKLRFRQHMANEMAHYASDCWDAELKTSYGWIECVGCADRSAFDLTVHSKKSKEKLIVREKLEEPYITTKWEITVDKKHFGIKFRKDSHKLTNYLLNLSQNELEKYAFKLQEREPITFSLECFESEISLDNSDITIELKKNKVHIREYIPNVIEPSFGIGRILYSVIEHSFWRRSENSSRAVFSFPSVVAPTKVLIVPLSNNKELISLTNETSLFLKSNKISFKVDDSGVSIGKRYSRNDELGTPFAITIDFDSLKDGALTLRERDSKLQVRDSLKRIIEAILNIIYNGMSWNLATKDMPIFETPTE